MENKAGNRESGRVRGFGRTVQGWRSFGDLKCGFESITRGRKQSSKSRFQFFFLAKLFKNRFALNGQSITHPAAGNKKNEKQDPDSFPVWKTGFVFAETFAPVILSTKRRRFGP